MRSFAVKISVYTMAVETFLPTLESLTKLLDKGSAHAQAKGLDLVNASLASDMYPLSKQVQLVCHFAQEATARLTGTPPPPMEEPAKTFPQLNAVIEKAIGYIRGVPASAFDGAEERDCTLEPPNLDFVIAMDGLTYLRSWVLPQYYFHLVTAYDILRHNGVAIGKQDYASWISAFVRPKAA